MKPEVLDFEVLVVEGRERFGLLLVRRDKSGETHRAYFYSSGKDGLEPPTEIISAGVPCEPLAANKDQHRILRELRAYARKFRSRGARHGATPIAEHYPEQKGYPQVLHHFFARSSSPLRKFFVSHQVFREKVLAKVRGQNEVIGKASSFAIRPPEDIPSEFLPPPEGKAWYELYLGALAAPSDLPSCRLQLNGRLTPPMSFEQPSHEQVLLGQSRVPLEPAFPLQLAEAVAQHRRVLLIGPAGSGKTCLLKSFVDDALRLRDSRRCEAPIPIYIQLNHVGHATQDVLRKQIVSTVMRTVATCPNQDIQKAASRVGARRPLSRHEALEVIRSEVDYWVRSANADEPPVVFLIIDGLSTLPPQVRYGIRDELEEFLGRRWAIVVAANSVQHENPLPSFAQLEILELSDDRIAQYLDATWPGKGDTIVSRLRVRNKGLLTLIRRPYYLHLYRETVDPSDPDSVAGKEGVLIERFVSRSYSRALEGRLRAASGVSEPDFHYALAELAKKAISRDTHGQGSHLLYPGDFKHPGAGKTSWRRVLRLAELCGVLAESGLSRSRADDEGRVWFSHDLFRDYYASRWLSHRKQHGKLGVPLLCSLLEYRSWDQPLRMLFDTIEAPDFQAWLALEIGNHDPYFAADCVARRSDWKPETTGQLLAILHQWELTEQTPETTACLSVRGIDASRKLLAIPGLSLPDPASTQDLAPSPCNFGWLLALLDQWEKDPVYRHLRKRSSRSLTDLNIQELAVLGHSCGERDYVLYRLVLLCNKLAKNSRSGLTELTTYLLSHPRLGLDLHSLHTLAYHATAPVAREAIYMNILTVDRSRMGKEKLEGLLLHEDVFVVLIAALRLGWEDLKVWDRCLHAIEKGGPGLLGYDHIFMMLHLASYAHPESLEPIAERWVRELLSKRMALPAIRSVRWLAAFETLTATRTLAEILCKGDAVHAKVVLLSLPKPRWRSAAWGRLLQDALRAMSTPMEQARALLVLAHQAALLSEAEQAMLNDTTAALVHEVLSSRSADAPNHEIDFALSCLAADYSRHRSDFEAIARRKDPASLIPLAYLALRCKEDMLTAASSSEDDQRVALRAIAARLVSPDNPLDFFLISEEIIALPASLDAKQTVALMQGLWNEIRSFLKENKKKEAYALLGLAQGLTHPTGRRWLSVRGEWPMSESEKPSN
jgi:hypothetical protein